MKIHKKCSIQTPHRAVRFLVSEKISVFHEKTSRTSADPNRSPKTHIPRFCRLKPPNGPPMKVLKQEVRAAVKKRACSEPYFYEQVSCPGTSACAPRKKAVETNCKTSSFVTLAQTCDCPLAFLSKVATTVKSSFTLTTTKQKQGFLDCRPCHATQPETASEKVGRIHHPVPSSSSFQLL